VDARLHQLQGKADVVSDLVALLQGFYRDKLTELLRHEAGARLLRPYDLNNTYQYFVNRDEVHLSCLERTIADLDGSTPQDVPAPQLSASGKDSDAWRPIVEQDARAAQAFVDRWRPRVEEMSNARHRGMLRVILGEALEQKRSFEQALAGELDLLGTRTAGVGARVGTVLPDRWIE
jgi:hypothetical protein